MEVPSRTLSQDVGFDSPRMGLSTHVLLEASPAAERYHCLIHSNVLAGSVGLGELGSKHVDKWLDFSLACTAITSNVQHSQDLLKPFPGHDGAEKGDVQALVVVPVLLDTWKLNYSHVKDDGDEGLHLGHRDILPLGI